MDDSTPRNTTTTLNQGVGGDSMDERLVTQEDNTTSAKRPVVALGHKDSRLVGDAQPLPVEEASEKELLGMLLEEARAIRALLEMVIDDTSTSAASTADGELT